MSDRRLAVIVFVFVVVAALGPTLAAGVPANQVPIQESNQGDSLAQPTGNAWESTTPTTIELASAPSTVPDASDTSVGQVEVRVAHTDEQLYVRLSWPDATADDEITNPRMFADAVAVQFPANASAHPGIAMGSTRTPVNVWYWSASGTHEELLAGGPGSTTSFIDPAVEATATRTDGRWIVVFQRPLVTEREERVSFEMDTDVDVAFAVWNGSNMERSGRKAVSEWHHLPTGPPPAGPPYETLLWAIAGLAIVVVIVVTAVAVRRASS